MNFKKKLSVLLLGGCLCNVALASESIHYSYSDYNQLKSVDNGISKLEYDYLSTGQLSDSKTSFHLTNTQNGFSYVYDDINRLVLIEDSDGNQSHFIYDALGHLILVQYQSAKDGLLEDAVSLKYNQKSQLTERLSYLSNTTEVLSYDGLGRLAKQLVYQGVDGQKSQLLSSLSYSYDALGRIIEKVRVNADGTSATENYVYDQMNQLSEYSCSGLLCSEDDEGNRLVSESYHYNAIGSLLTVESHYANGGYSEMAYQYNNDYPDRLDSYSKDNTSYSFSYDQMGNMVIDEQGNQIHYNGFGRIDQVIQPNTNQSSDYYYNGLNELVSAKNNNHYEQYLYSQLGLMGVDSIDSTNNEITSTQRYLYAGSDKVGVSSQSKDNQASYQGYVKDYAGSILALIEKTDEAVSSIVQSYRYTPYGEVTKTQAAGNNQTSQLGYNGELTDNATSWQLLGRGTRAYNPRIRQFTSSDIWSPFGRGGINSYAYLSQANPVMYSDPSGHMKLNRQVPIQRKSEGPHMSQEVKLGSEAKLSITQALHKTKDENILRKYIIDRALSYNETHYVKKNGGDYWSYEQIDSISGYAWWSGGGPSRDGNPNAHANSLALIQQNHGEEPFHILETTTLALAIEMALSDIPMFGPNSRWSDIGAHFWGVASDIYTRNAIMNLASNPGLTLRVYLYNGYVSPTSVWLTVEQKRIADMMVEYGINKEVEEYNLGGIAKKRRRAQAIVAQT